MLPDFPKKKKIAMKHINKELKNRILSRLGPFQNIPQHRHHEGSSWTILRVDGDAETSEYKEVSSKTPTIKLSDIPDMSQNEVNKIFINIIEEMSEQQLQHFFVKINSATEKTGNTFDAKGKPLTPEILLEMVEKVDFSFNKSGEPNLQCVAHPSLCERFIEIQKDPTFQEKYNHIIAKKRDDWRVREASRKLVD